MIRNDAHTIIEKSIQSMLPDEAVKKALKEKNLDQVILIAVGKAGYSMARAAQDVLKEKIKKGIVVTKYDHSGTPLPNIDIYEASHPIPDENTIKATEKVLEMVENLNASDQILFLLSGGGSALFEKPLEGVTLQDVQDITQQLLSCGADIIEINTIRKHLSAVKGGRFAEKCAPAKLFSIVLSDVIDDRLDFIASGPACPDSSTIQDVQRIIEKYHLSIPPQVARVFNIETPKALENVETMVTGSVAAFCQSAAAIAKDLGYTPLICATSLDGEAREVGKVMASMARSVCANEMNIQTPCAIIFGGETVVHLKGKGKGGRNQELALAAAQGIQGLIDVVVFSVGSDGTDGPTDAAGGIVDGTTYVTLKEKGIDPAQVLENNDAYHALASCEGLIMTGPTGTNVNDLSVLLVGKKNKRIQ